MKLQREKRQRSIPWVKGTALLESIMPGLLEYQLDRVTPSTLPLNLQMLISGFQLRRKVAERCLRPRFGQVSVRDFRVKASKERLRQAIKI